MAFESGIAGISGMTGLSGRWRLEVIKVLFDVKKDGARDAGRGVRGGGGRQ